MEEIPRTSMITLDLKTSIGVDFSNPIRRYIRDYYHEDPDNYSDELARLKQLRANAITPTRDYSGCSVLRRYFCQLHFLEARFPMKEGEAAAIAFSWTDPLSGKSVSMSDISYDQSAILYNLGALHSQLGDYDSRTTDDGMRVSCTHFQCAAGAFDYLKENFAVAATPDLSSELMAMYTSVMLAQAQECLLEKSVKEKRKGGINSKVARQVANYYSTALLVAESSKAVAASKKYKTWQKHFEHKSLYFAALALMFAATGSEEQGKHGEEVGYLKAAAAKIEEAGKIAKDDAKAKEAVRLVSEAIAKLLESAVKNNDFVYHEAVPELDALPEIKASSLVKPMPFQPSDPSVSGHDIFAKLIPMEAHELSSVYSEEKARLLRHIGSLIEGKDADLKQTMESLSLEDVLKPHSVPKTLPPQLHEKYEEMKDKKDVLDHLRESLDELDLLSAKAKTSLDQVEALLEEDEKQEKLIEEKFGPRSQPKELADLHAELKQFQEAHAKGMSTNVDIVEKFKQNQGHFEHLTGSQDALLASLPTQSLLDSPIDEELVENLQKLLGKVDQMKAQRTQLESDLREKINKDDITSQIVTAEKDAQDKFFSKELEKHNDVVDLIRQNLDAQDRILAALTEANAKYASVRQNLQEIDEQREQIVEQIVEAADVFPNLDARTEKGLGFFKRLDEKAAQLLNKTRDVCASRQRERPALVPEAPVRPVVAPASAPDRAEPQGRFASLTHSHPPSRSSLPPKPAHLLGGVPAPATTASPVPSLGAATFSPATQSSTWSPLVSPAPPSSERVVIGGQSQPDPISAMTRVVVAGGERSTSSLVVERERALPASGGKVAALQKVVSDVEAQLKALSEVSSHDNRFGMTRDWEALNAFEAEDAKSFTVHAARIHSHMNRSADSVPYDQNRVKLRGVAADYINACYLDDLSPPRHIAAQSPLSSDAVDDFWTMVWECRVVAIVMLDREIEDGKVSCHRYWPEGGGHVLKTGPLEVTLQSYRETSVCVCRYVCIRNTKDNEERTVAHLEYRDSSEKSDVAVSSGGLPPLAMKGFCEFLLEGMAVYRRFARNDEPLIVHSSDGGSRIGAFVVLHSAMRSIDDGNSTVNVFNLVRLLKKQRMQTIKSKEEYIFCHTALLYLVRRVLSGSQAIDESPAPSSLPSLSPAPAQDSPEPRRNDPLSSLNPFWKIGVDRKKPAQPADEFDPLSSAPRSRAATVAAATASSAPPHSGLYKSYESVETSSGNVVNVRGAAISSEREQAATATTTTVATAAPAPMATLANVVQIPSFVTSLLAEKEKQIEMQALKIAEQDRVIGEQRKRIIDMEMAFGDLRRQFDECRQLAEEKQRVVDELKSKLIGSQSLEVQLEQLKSFVLVEKRKQEVHRQEDKHYQQQLQQQLQIQQAELNKQKEDQRRQDAEKQRILEQQHRNQQPLPSPAPMLSPAPTPGTPVWGDGSRFPASQPQTMQPQPAQPQPIQPQPLQLAQPVQAQPTQPQPLQSVQPVQHQPQAQLIHPQHHQQITHPPQQGSTRPLPPPMQQQQQQPILGQNPASLQVVGRGQPLPQRPNEPSHYFHQPAAAAGQVSPQAGIAQNPLAGVKPYQPRDQYRGRGGPPSTFQGHSQQFRPSQPIPMQTSVSQPLPQQRYPSQFQPAMAPGQMHPNPNQIMQQQQPQAQHGTVQNPSLAQQHSYVQK